MAPAEEPELKTSIPVHKTLCSVVPHIGVNVCMEVMSCDATFIKNTTLYNMIGQHGVHINIVRGKCLKSNLHIIIISLFIGIEKLLKNVLFIDS